MADEVESLEAPNLAKKAHTLYRQSRDHTAEWRSDARTAFDMEAGEQWADADREKMKTELRVPVTFDRISRTINAIAGTQINNRQETRFIPREQGDAQVNEILTAAAEWARDNCDAEDEESDAFRDMAVCGMGWTETRLDYAIDPDGAMVIDRVDPLEMYWDPGATKRNLSDARWFMRVRMMSPAEFAEMWPDAEVDPSTAPWEGSDDTDNRRTHVYPQDAYKHNQAMRGDKAAPKIMVAQLQWAESVPEYRVGKEAKAVPAEEFEPVKEKFETSGIAFVKQEKLVWKQAFVAGDTVLDAGDCPFPDGPTFRCMTYKRDRNRNVWYGLVKAMIDPQRFGNKFFSLILDILNKGAKGGVIAEKDAFEDPRQVEEKWARPDSVIWARPGSMVQGKIMPKPVVELPAGLDRLMTFALDGVHETAGLNLELLGFADRQQPGVLEHQRKQAGLTIIAPLFDAMRRYRKEQGRVLLYFLQTYLSDGRLIRIVGQAGSEQYVPLAKQPEAVRYDVIVDEAPQSPNMKERVFGTMIEMLPSLGKMGIMPPPEVLDYSPLPSGLVAKWKEQIETSGGNPEQMRQQMEQMGKELTKFQQENAQLKDKRAESEAQLRFKQEESAVDFAMKQEEMRAELALERQKAEAQIALEREKIRSELEIERMKLAAQAERQQEEMRLKRQAQDFANGIAQEDAELKSGHTPMVGGIAKALEQQAEEHAALREALREMIQVMGQKPKQIVVQRDPQSGLLIGAELVH